MRKTRFISFIALGLLITNLLLVVFILFNKPQTRPYEGPKKLIAERLHFDAEQIEVYDNLIAIHRTHMNTKDSLIKQAKNELYTCIISGNLITKDSLKNQLGQLQIEIEDIHYNHFLDIKKLCRENQLNDFTALLKDMVQLFSKEPKDRPHP